MSRSSVSGYGGGSTQGGNGSRAHRPPPVSSSRSKADSERRVPRPRYSDDRVGVGAPRSTIGAPPTQVNSPQKAQRYQHVRSSLYLPCGSSCVCIVFV
jgi:hypothetical protein